MTPAIVLDRLMRVIGSNSVAGLGSDRVLVTPQSDSACSAILRTATNEGWKIRVTGNADDGEVDAPCDIVMSTENLDTPTDVQPADLVATAAAGTRLARVHSDLAERGMWLAVDPPGAGASVGGVIAAASSGAFQTGFGPIRDQVLGMTIITGAGRRIVGGGRVVKNVAGYDIPKLMIGGFGAFGVITQVHFRLRVATARDVSLTQQGNRADMIELKNQIDNSTINPAALEVRSGDEKHWRIVIRLMGTTETVARNQGELSSITSKAWDKVAPGETPWGNHEAEPTQDSIMLRFGPNRETLDWTLDQLQDTLPAGQTSVFGTRHLIRWSGMTDGTTIRELRRAVATKDVPLTIERGPWSLVEAEGHFGELKSGVGGLVKALRSAFDPTHTLVVPLGATTEVGVT